MAENFKKVKKYVKGEDVDSLISQWTSAGTVEMSDGKTLEETYGDINENLDDKLDKQSPNGTGSLSLNRQVDTTVGNYSVAIGDRTTATAKAAFAEGCLTEATGSQSHAEGDGTKSTAIGSHSEGGYATDNAGVKYFTTASNSYAHAEGAGTTASGIASHSEGSLTQATGKGSHSEGINTTASNQSAHAEGANSIASGTASHAEGYDTEASGYGSHSEGSETKAKGNYSHTEGSGTIAQWHNQHVQGRYNEELTEEEAKKLAHVVGGGTYNNGNPIRKNIHTLDWEGNATFAGDVIATDADGNTISVSEMKDYVTTLEGKSESTVATAISTHNVNTEAHNDIRILVEELTTRLNAVADSENIDLDQLSEIVAYIQSNRSLIDSITTSKVSITDIVDNLTTNVANKPLSAAQGVTIKGLIDTLNTAVGNKANTSDLTSHTGNTTAHVTSENKDNWNAIYNLPRITNSQIDSLF